VKISTLLVMLLLTTRANAQAPETASSPAPSVSDSSDYEVDYEEEPGSEEADEPVEEVPVKPKKGSAKGSQLSKDTTSQGSRAEKKIAPLMKSNPKSVYKKNGKSLDVDPD
jgi:hypothetical protein